MKFISNVLKCDFFIFQDHLIHEMYFVHKASAKPFTKFHTNEVKKKKTDKQHRFLRHYP